eukprot:TRINITY_DN64677_c0_g1_i1.p1 TRINITY_DN64677_c0_g1~~TRINITY_DN64677_c0_g1_i1.p1  ORF type:complete len:349 (+),score=57.26 TRINITY_DN64677_c0_g1_i1:51-1097(+)
MLHPSGEQVALMEAYGNKALTCDDLGSASPLGPRMKTSTGSHAVPAGDGDTSPELEDTQVPELAPLEALLPMALERVERLERVVAGHQKQFDELVPLQREILNMYAVLRGHHSAAYDLHLSLREEHEALCEEHDELCTSLLAAGLLGEDGKQEPGRRRRGTWPTKQFREGQQAPPDRTSAVAEPAAVESLRIAAGSDDWQQLRTTSRVLSSARRAPAAVEERVQAPQLVAVSDPKPAPQLDLSAEDSDPANTSFTLQTSDTWTRLHSPNVRPSPERPWSKSQGTPGGTPHDERVSRSRLMGSLSLSALPPPPLPHSRLATHPPPPHDLPPPRHRRHSHSEGVTSRAPD